MSLPEKSVMQAGHIPNWKLLNQLRDDFWTRWKRDYLQDLQPRNKWRKPNANLKVGSIVLILSENTPLTQWPLALVKELHLGDDELVRTATVRTASSEFKRIIAKLILLPIEPVDLV